MQHILYIILRAASSPAPRLSAAQGPGPQLCGTEALPMFLPNQLAGEAVSSASIVAAVAFPVAGMPASA